MTQNFNIEKYVNLRSYSDSLGWMGYYARKCKYSHLLMNESIDQFISFFKEITPKVSIVTSLFKFYINHSKITREQLELIKSGYLRDFTQEYNEDILDEFKLWKDVDWDIVRKLSSIIMDHEGDIDGHCFILCETLHLIIYPHDDTGYGFISSSINLDSHPIVNNFFNRLDVNKFMYEKQYKE